MTPGPLTPAQLALAGYRVRTDPTVTNLEKRLVHTCNALATERDVLAAKIEATQDTTPYPKLLSCYLCESMARVETPEELTAWGNQHHQEHAARGEVLQYTVLPVPTAPDLIDLGGGFRAYVDDKPRRPGRGGRDNMIRSFLRRFRIYFAFTQGTEAATQGPWYVTENDLIGGWCIRTVDEPPSHGNGITIADFMREEDAHLCAAARNMYMRTETPTHLRHAATADLAVGKDGQLYLKRGGTA